MIKTTYTDPLSKTRTWEHAERPTRPANSDIDGVGILAILEKESGPEVLLQKQFRPPLGKVVIEVPAGLIDEGETAEEAAVRELKEETGYIGVVSESSPVMWNGESFPYIFEKEAECIFCSRNGCGADVTPEGIDPGFCTTNLKMVHVTIDMDLEENRNPKPQLEESEFIEVFTLPLRDLWSACKRLEKEGYAIDARVGTIAEGIEVARQWKL